jgi:hypothetical protein
MKEEGRRMKDEVKVERLKAKKARETRTTEGKGEAGLRG